MAIWRRGISGNGDSLVLFELPNESGINVGIGVDNPTSKLEIAGGDVSFDQVQTSGDIDCLGNMVTLGNVLVGDSSNPGIGIFDSRLKVLGGVKYAFDQSEQLTANRPTYLPNGVNGTFFVKGLKTATVVDGQITQIVFTG